MVPSTPVKSTPTRTYEDAPPPTPRSASANEIKNRHQLQASTTLAISHFSSLLADLTASYSDTGSHLAGGGRVTERTRLDRIESFREDWMVGALMRVTPPALLPEGEEETFSDGTRHSLGGGTASSVASDSSPCPHPLRPRYLPLDPLERGIIAEKTIKADLTRRNALLLHKDFASLPRMAQRAIRRTLRTGKAVYVAPGLLASPNWVKEYEQHGWARPGIRWGNVKPDLIRFEEVKTKGSAEGEPRVVSFEVVEIKYQGQSGREVIYTNYKVQALFYHLALTKLLSAIPSLIPSHRASLWLSRDPHSPTYTEKPVAIRTSLAFVEHHLFVLLPQWLHAVTTTEWASYEERRERLRLVKKLEVPTPSLATPALTFLDRLQTSKGAPPTPTPMRVTSLRQVPLASRSKPSTLPSVSHIHKATRIPVHLSPLPDEDDDDLHFPPLPDQTKEELVDLLGALTLQQG